MVYRYRSCENLVKELVLRVAWPTALRIFSPVFNVRSQFMKNIFIVFLCAIFLHGCCHAVPVIQHEGLSRTYINLNLEKTTENYENTREVGGEHIDIYYYMVPADRVCEVSISSREGNASAYLVSNGETIWSTSGRTTVAQRHKIIGPEMWRFELEVMAHPYDIYTIKIFQTKKSS